MRLQINPDDRTYKMLKIEKIKRDKNTLAETAEEILSEVLR